MYVRARVLTEEEAIGNPEADDFYLQGGKERLMQAEFFDAGGQAFTNRFGNFESSLEDVLHNITKIDGLSNNLEPVATSQTHCHQISRV